MKMQSYNNVEINFIHQDMSTYKEKKSDVIISNPPYIKYDEEIMATFMKPVLTATNISVALYNFGKFEIA